MRINDNWTCFPDEEEEPRLLQLTDQHKNAIRAIRKVRFFVAWRYMRFFLFTIGSKEDVLQQELRKL